MKKSSVLLLMFLAVPPANAQTAPSTAAATNAAPTRPIELSGYLAPIDAQELKPKLKRFATSLVVSEVVPHGAAVKAGQALVKFDLVELEQDILEAASDLDVAKAALAKADADAKSGERTDAATLEERTDAATDAETNLAWWRDVQGPDFLKQVDLAVKAAADEVEDQGDELDQLRKMYKSEELTNATADIVVKRAVRTYERSKEKLAIAKHAADKQRATDYPDKKQEVERALTAARRALEDAKAQIAQSQVTRAATILKARSGLRDAQRKLSELEQDKDSLDLKAKTDGIVYFGTFSNGAWQGGAPDAIKVGEKQDLTKLTMTVVQPGKLRVVAAVDEANFFRVSEGTAGTVNVAALPTATIAGKFGAREPLPSADGTFRQLVDFAAAADARLVPGMKVKIAVQETK